MGIVSPIGTGLENYWRSLSEGKNGCQKVTQFDTSKYKTDIAGEIKDKEHEKYLSDEEVALFYRSSQFAVSAARMAFEDSNLDYDKVDKDRFGTCMGSNTPDPATGEEIVYLLAKDDYSLKPTTKAQISSITNKAMEVAKPFDFHGPNLFIPTACAAGNYCLGYAFDLIKSGKADYMFAGGADPMNQLGFAGFNRLRAFAPDKCRPFDKNRKGLVMSEGSGVLVLEEMKSAEERGAKIYAEILGYGLGCDAYHPTAPHPEGNGGVIAMEDAFKRSGITSDEIDYINAHGTGTLANDMVEVKVIEKVFKERSKTVAVSSVKSMIGHMMGAASAAEAIATCLAIKNEMMPPTINFEEKDPNCDIDCVPNTARKAEINIAVSNSFAFGGNIAMVVFKKYKDE